ncbi:DUF3302 domain-containing protein [Mesorhizobium sp. STM 4661]|uniref:DUF3302 domain-containing protein n=1 Tax=Mesorhizobium sp. STM 4661 TaxID=1297570 RepID=UPI0002BD803D|nr:DUF3302 domain-containing protein [Mesorhizobium sp. STM 4661]CCV14360.1 conserved exported hypothetical protein [Mesorhizobium sp. STM 4661]
MLNTVALITLIIVLLLVAYGAVAVWAIPYEIAKARNHPHQDAIGAATWVSLFTLGALWPFLWIWAILYHPDRGWGVSTTAVSENSAEISQIDKRLSALERAQQHVR